MITVMRGTDSETQGVSYEPLESLQKKQFQSNNRDSFRKLEDEITFRNLEHCKKVNWLLGSLKCIKNKHSTDLEKRLRSETHRLVYNRHLEMMNKLQTPKENLYLGWQSSNVKKKYVDMIYDRYRKTVFVDLNSIYTGVDKVIPDLKHSISWLKSLFPDKSSYSQYCTEMKIDENNYRFPIIWESDLYSSNNKEMIAVTDITEFTIERTVSSNIFQQFFSNSSKKEIITVAVPTRIRLNSNLIDDYLRLKIAISHELCHIAEISYLQQLINEYKVHSSENDDNKVKELEVKLNHIINKPLNHSKQFLEFTRLFSHNTFNEYVPTSILFKRRPKLKINLTYKFIQSNKGIDIFRYKFNPLLMNRYSNLPFRKLTFLDSIRRSGIIKITPKFITI